MVSLPRRSVDRALEADRAPGRAGAGPEVDDVVGDGDRLRLVLDHEHGVALVAQLEQQLVHPLDVVGVEADGRLVEDVGDVGERRAQVADHLGALGLAAGQRARRPVEREVAEPDLGERVEEVLQAGDQRGHRRLLELADPLGQVADLHGAQVGDVLALDLRGPGLLAQPGAVALGAGLEGDHSLDEGADVRLHRLDVLGQHRLLDLGDHALVGQVDALDLDLRGLLVEEVVELLLGELLDRLVHVEAEAGEDPAVPAVHAVAGDHQGALAERLLLVVEGGEVEVGDRPHPLAAGAHAAEVDHVAHDVLLHPAARLLRAHHAARLARRDVERERRRRPDVGLADPAEQDAQHRVGVGGGADGGARVGAHPLLVDDDRRGQPLQQVDLRPRQVRHEALHERAVGLVDHPLRLGSDGAEHQRALAGAGDPGEGREPPLGQLDADVLEVVLARTLHADQVVAVGVVHAGLGHPGAPSRRCSQP